MIGDKILELRKRNDLSQEKLAEKIDVTRQTISNWELNTTVPDLKQASELAKVFNVSLDELVGNNKEDILYDKVSKTEENSNLILKKISRLNTLSLVYFALFLIIVLVLWNLFCSVYFTNTISATTQCALTECEFEGKRYRYIISKNLADGSLTLTSNDNSILETFEIGKYSDYQVAFDDLIKEVEAKGAKCGFNPE